jgi:hypothetical protein
LALLTGAALEMTPHAVEAQHAGPADWTAVDQALGRPGASLPGGVRKYGFPRSDLRVTVDGVQLRPALALGSWVAFAPLDGTRAMVMGDLVLTEDDVAPVMRALQQAGIRTTALHNHLLHESPHIMYMHIAADGDRAAIAKGIRAALAATATPLAPPAAAPAAPPFDLDTAAIARALGAHGTVNGGVYQVGVPRRDVVRVNGRVVPPAMGVATGINFQPTGGGRAAISGDFVMRPAEVNAVIRALQQSGIEITALHSHMLDEEPRLFFMHFWADDDAAKLARGLRAALDHMAVKLTTP